MADLLVIMESCERASKEDLEKIFTKVTHEISLSPSALSQYATVERNGEFFMTHDDFVCHYLQLAEVHCEQQTKRVLARVADTSRNGSVLSLHSRINSSLSPAQPHLSGRV